MRCILAIIIVGSLLAPGASIGQVECPTDSLNAGCGWTATQSSSGSASSTCLIPSLGYSWALYNLALGTSRVRAVSIQTIPMVANLRLHDTYVLDGPVSTEPHLIWAQFELTYFLRNGDDYASSLPGRGGTYVRLYSGDAAVVDSIHGGPFAMIDTVHPLVLPIWVTPNQPFEVGYSAYAWSLYDAFSNLDIAIDFAGLPLGYTVTSCQGFSTAGSVPVPTRRASWGRLKSIYR